MPISMKGSVGGGGVSLGECLHMSDSHSPLVDLNGQVYLKSGNIMVEEDDIYPEAFSEFAANLPADGRNWITLDNNLAGTADGKRDGIYANGYYYHYVTGSSENPGYILKSPDGLVWESIPGPTGAGALHGLQYFKGLFLAIHSSPNYATKECISFSSDLVNWTARTGPHISSPFHLAVSSTMAVAVGAYNAQSFPQNLYYSSDGMNWTITTGTTVTRDFPLRLRCANNTFFLTNYADYPAAYAEKCFYSTNGTTWTALGVPPPGFGDYGLSDITYGKGLWVMAVGSSIYTTTGLSSSWTLRLSSSTRSFTALFFDGNKFITVGDQIWISYDGIGWEQVNTASPSWTPSHYQFPVGAPVDNPKMISNGKTTQMAPQQYVGVQGYTEREGSPLYMRIK